MPRHKKLLVGALLATGVCTAALIGGASSASANPLPPCPLHSILEGGNVTVWVGCTEVIDLPLGE